MDLALTEKYTSPTVPAGKHLIGKVAEGAYGGTFVAAAVKRRGKQIHNEWVEKGEYDDHARKVSLAQKRALLNDGGYFEGRAGDDEWHPDRRVPSRFKKAKQPLALTHTPP